ncbi:MAG: pyridoxamine 5'-phosphate oxidase [Gammaproteobacteria bacterium]|jgi:pyridoxamine 5'-phosphate oxidase
MTVTRAIAPGHADPLAVFDDWYAQAAEADLVEPTAMALATVEPDGTPSVRMVLLKEHGREGFVFYTNYCSPKARALISHPHASLLFWWPPLQRQVRISGSAVRLPEAESDAYFATRPRGSQLGAWASPQSRPLPDRAALDKRLAEAERRFADSPVPRPADWGGFRLHPATYEFWQGRADRLHDRHRYTATPDGWRIDYLAP